MVERRYHILDVFAGKPLAGNPLAVVLDADGLDDAAMQRIAGEFNLSETVFVLEPRDPVHFARLRIFTPAAELPFAGHPTVGAAILLASLRAPELLRAGEVGLVLEEGIGPVSCTARHRRGEAAHARFEAPRLPEPWGDPPDPAALATMLGLKPDEVGGALAGHAPSRYDAGVPFTFVPLASLDALARARLRAPAHEERALYYLYADDPEPGDAEFHVRARMLAHGLGVGEDPATGSAAVAFAGTLARCGRLLPDGDHDCRIVQGVEMGRPSRIGLAFTIDGGRLASVTVGGEAVVVADGVLRL